MGQAQQQLTQLCHQDIFFHSGQNHGRGTAEGSRIQPDSYQLFWTLSHTENQAQYHDIVQTAQRKAGRLLPREPGSRDTTHPCAL